MATRANPKRLADEAKQSAITKAQSPVGKAVIGGVGAVVLLLIARRIRKARKSK